MKHFRVGQVAVIGAGVMGSQIAAHFVNAGFRVFLFDLKTPDNANALIEKALVGLTKLKPAPLAIDDASAFITSANLDDDCALLQSCNLIIEAVAENLDIKKSLYKKIIPFIHDEAVLATNTSGLSVNTLRDVLPPKYRSRFLGIHFFNPPRYMRLVELIRTDQTNEDILQTLETFLVSVLGKGVIHAKDTPNFIANRVGVFAWLSTVWYAERFKLPFDIVDSLTGVLMGRPKSGTFRLADVIGLDTMGHVVATMREHLTIDPWANHYHLPDWLTKLIAAGTLGQKTGQGIYKKEGKEILVLDPASGEYRASQAKPSDEVISILKTKDTAARFKALRESSHPEAEFIWSCYRDLFQYCAVHAKSISSSVRDIDCALRWGFGWQQGPFEIWQDAGLQAVATWIDEDIAAGKTLASSSLPQWVLADANAGFYQDGKAYHFSDRSYHPRSPLPVYQKQLFPESMCSDVFDEGETILETDVVRLWHQNDGIAILNFKSKMNTISNAVLEGILAAIEFAEKDYKALVIWQRHGAHFSLGADLREFKALVDEGKTSEVEAGIRLFQATTSRVRYAAIPVVAAVQGMVLGGGCELMLHCDRVVAALESYIGLVELGVGLVPAGGGCKEAVIRAMQTHPDDAHQGIAHFYWQVAKAETSSSALDARKRGWLRESDIIIFNPDELLYQAKKQANILCELNYRPPRQSMIKVSGKESWSRLMAELVNWYEGGFISEYDYYLGQRLGHIFTGGSLSSGQIVTEEWLHRLELDVFIELVQQASTQARIDHTLKTGKPLRN